jgi:hypothetical protein
MQLANATEEEGRRGRRKRGRRREVRGEQIVATGYIRSSIFLHPDVFFVNFVM